MDARGLKTDEELMLAYRAGDTTAFDELFGRFAPQLTNALRRFGFGPDRLRDLVQQTFLQMHRARNDFHDNAELRPWLMTIAFNLAREELRRHRRRPEAPLDLATHNAPPHSLLDQQRADLRRDLSRAIAHLPGDQQEVVRLHFVEELSFDEIGQRLGATAGAVRVRAHRGYAALRKLLSASNPVDDCDISKEIGS